jgi:hypothetical protein
MPAFSRRVATIGALLAATALAACGTSTSTTTALSSTPGQLFCAIATGGGDTIVAGIIDAAATAKAPSLAPVAVLATNAAAATVQADCAAAAATEGAKSAIPVSPPAGPVPSVAIMPAR